MYLVEFIILFILQKSVAQSHTNFAINRFEICVKNSPVTFFGNITKENNNQYLEFNLTSPIPLDKNVAFCCDIETMINEVFLPLYTIRENDFCKAANKYGGEVWYDVERAAQLIPGRCPILAGRYHVHHMLLDPRKLTLQTFPFGTLRFTIKGIDRRQNQVVFCHKLEVENNSF